MNGLEAIENEIISQANAKAQETLARANEQAQQILEKAKAAAEEELAAAKAQAEQSAAVFVAQQQQSAAQLAKKEYATDCQQLVYSVFERAFEQLCSLPQDSYFALLEKLARAAALPGGELLLNAKDREKYGKRLAAQTGIALADDTAEIAGGVVVRSGQVENNASLEVVIREAREANAYDISQLLFS